MRKTRLLLFMIISLFFLALQSFETGFISDKFPLPADIKRTENFPEFYEAKPVKVVVSPLNNRLLVISEDPPSVIEYDPSTQILRDLVQLPEKPTGAVLSGNSRRLFVTSGGSDGLVTEVDIENHKVIRHFYTNGHTPGAPVLSPDEKFLYVGNRFNNEVVKINLNMGKVVKRFPVIREPACLVISEDGRNLFAGNFLPAGPSDVKRVNSSVSVIDLKQETIQTIEMPNGSNAIRAMALSPDGKSLYLTHILARHQVPTSQIERGWINTNALSIIDVEKRNLMATVLLDDHYLGFSNPSAIVCSPDGEFILVASLGGNELSLINRNKLHDKIKGSGLTTDIKEVEINDFTNDLLFMSAIRRQRIPLPGYGPNSLVFLGNDVYVTEYYSGTLAVISMGNTPLKVRRHIAMGDKDTSLNMIRYGEMLFNNADLCYQQWQSCASCHPGGRMDGLNWDLLNDGIGNSKNTRSMLYAHKTPPSMALGVRATAEEAVRAGIRYIQFATVEEQQARAIDIYLQSLTPLPSPYLVNNELSISASRGQVLFEREGCMTCHPAPLFTDLKNYNVNSGKDTEEMKAFDNPALVEVWRTAPYLHDGRAKNMEELISVHNPNGTNSLTTDERSDLIEFVLSL